ncbi:hypothetical protein N8081_01065 [Pseudomonadota bacterium]|nr:hypothetical protein [Pseudomonadota bacterium]
MIRITILIIFIFTLTACIDDISLTQKKDQGTVKEVKDITYFISKSGTLYEKIKGIFVESKFVTDKEANTIKKYTLKHLAYLPYELTSEIKYIDNKLYSYFYLKAKNLYAKNILKTFNKNEDPSIDLSLYKGQVKAEMQDDYSRYGCRNFLSKAEFYKNTDEEYQTLKPLKDFASPCKNIELFAEDYNYAENLVNLISEYNKRLLMALKQGLFKSSNILVHVNLEYDHDNFLIHTIKFKGGSNTVSRYGSVLGYLKQGNVRGITFNQFLNIKSMSQSWQEGLKYNDFKNETLKLKNEIDKLSNKVFHPQKLLNENLIKDPTIKGTRSYL